MTFEKNTILAGAGLVLGAAALIFSITTKNQVSDTSKSLTFDTSINIDIEGEEEVERHFDAGEGEYVFDSADLESGEMNLILRDGTLRIVDSYVRVPQPETSEVEDNLYVYLPGEHTLRYDSTNCYLVCDGSIIIRTIDALDATYNGVSQFMGANGEAILIGERKVNSMSAITVISTLPSSEVTDDDIAVVQTLLNNAKSNVVIAKLTLFGKQVNADWAENVIMTPKALELIKGTQRVYISPYSGTFADGATNTLAAGGITFTYSDNIKDNATGYAPYIYSFNSDQNGMVTASGTSAQLKVKVLAQNNMIMKDLFN